MRFINMPRRFIQLCLMNKLRIMICSFIILIFTALGIDILITEPHPGIKIYVFDILVHPTAKVGLLGQSILVFPVLPLFSVIVMGLLSKEESIYCTLRFKSRKALWNRKILYCSFISVIFATIYVFGGYIISGKICGSYLNGWILKDSFVYQILAHNKEWHNIRLFLSTFNILSISFITYVIGLITCSVLMCTLKELFGNKISYILVIIIFVTDLILLKGYLIINKMTINLKNWLNPQTILLNNIYLICLIIIFYLAGFMIKTKQDYLGNKKIN